MRYLFLHQNFPGQFLHTSSVLADRGNEVVALSQRGKRVHPRIKSLQYKSPPPEPGVHPFVRTFEAAVRNGEAVAEICSVLKKNGLVPDLVVGHTGWGETLFIKDVWPGTPLLGYFEYYYRYASSDVTFDPEFPPTARDPWRIRGMNAPIQLALEAADVGVTPTEWQRSLFPPPKGEDLQVLHEGIDTEAAQPVDYSEIALDSGIRLTSRDPVITFSARNLEPYRGFHVFMRALARLQQRNPDAQAVIVGSDGVSYGRRPAGYATYRDQMLTELRGQLDLSRIHFTGPLPYRQYINLLQVSSAHVYLTYPFVLSWSLLEAMAIGCVIIGSRTGPVEEVIEDGHNGLLVDFFDAEALARQLDYAVRYRSSLRELRRQARQTILDRYDLRRVCLPAQLTLYDKMATRTRPPIHQRRATRGRDNAEGTI